jgi:hypothetical protein
MVVNDMIFLLHGLIQISAVRLQIGHSILVKWLHPF